MVRRWRGPESDDMCLVCLFGICHVNFSGLLIPFKYSIIHLLHLLICILIDSTYGRYLDKANEPPGIAPNFPYLYS